MTNGVAGSGQNAQLSYEIITPYGIYKDDVLEQLGARVPKAQALSWMRKLAGSGAGGRMVPKRIAKQHKVSHYEERDHLRFRATIASADNGTANETTITLSTADHFDSGKNSIPKVGDTAVFTTEATGYVTAVDKTTDNAHTVTIQEQNSSEDVQTPAVAGASVVFFSNEQGGGSKKRGSHVPGFDRYDFEIATTREDIEIEDHEVQNGTWFTYKGQDKVYVKALDEMADKFAMKEELKLLIGKTSENLTSPEGKDIHSGTGLIPQATAGGINFDYFGSPSLTTLENLELLYNKFYGDNENLIVSGINADQGWRKWLLDFTEGGGRDISFAGKSKQEIGINMKSAHIGSYTFHFDTWEILSHAGTLGADGMPYADMILGIPLGGGNAYIPGQDGYMEKEYRDYFRLVYAPAPSTGGGRIVDDAYIWEYGAFAPNHSSDEAVRGVSMISYKTLELMCINKFAVARKKG